MPLAAAVAALLTGAVSIAGGILGFVRAKSRPSLIAGVGIGDLLIIGAILSLLGLAWGLWLAVAGAGALLGRFLPVYVKDPTKVWPALVMAALGAITLTFALATLLR